MVVTIVEGSIASGLVGRVIIVAVEGGLGGTEEVLLREGLGARYCFQSMVVA